MDQFTNNGQQGPPVVGGYAPASNQELLFRTMAGVAPYAAQALGRRRGIGGSITGIGAGLAGAYGGTMADELMRQRTDPVAQQLRVAQQLQDLGTKPLAPTPLPSDTTFSMPAEGQPTLPPAPLTPGPGIAGQPTFSVENIPQTQRIAFAKDILPLQQQEAATQQIAASKAATALHQAQIGLVPLEAEKTKATTAGLQAEAETRARDLKATQDFTTGIQAYKAANPGINDRQLASYAGNLALQTGAPEKAVKPFLDSLSTNATIDFHNATIAFHNRALDIQAAHNKALEANAAAALAKGDVTDARNIVNNEMQGYDRAVREGDARIKATDAAIKAHQGIVSDPLSKPDEKKEATAQIKALREARQSFDQQIQADKASKKDAADRMKELFSGTKAGAAVVSRIGDRPPPPPSSGGPAAGSIPGPAPKTLEEFIQQRGSRR